MQKGEASKELRFTRPVILFVTELFNDTLNQKALHLGLVHYDSANGLALAGGVRGLWFLFWIPKACARRRILVFAFERLLPPVMRQHVQSVYVFSGGAIKQDGILGACPTNRCDTHM